MRPTIREQYEALREFHKHTQRHLDALKELLEYSASSEPAWLQVALPGQKAIALSELRNLTCECQSLIVVDPYVFAGMAEISTAIAGDLAESASAKGGSLKTIHFVYDESKRDAGVHAEVHETFQRRGIKVSEAVTNKIHDRVWIADRTRALVVGTSFNGIGRRAAFLLPLPIIDLQVFLDYLDSQGLSPP